MHHNRAALTLVATTALLSMASGLYAADAPTYSSDVAAILNQSCVSCHRPGEIAPMSLLSYS